MTINVENLRKRIKDIGLLKICRAINDINLHELNNFVNGSQLRNEKIILIDKHLNSISGDRKSFDMFWKKSKLLLSL